MKAFAVFALGVILGIGLSSYAYYTLKLNKRVKEELGVQKKRTEDLENPVKINPAYNLKVSFIIYENGYLRGRLSAYERLNNSTRTERELWKRDSLDFMKVLRNE